MLTFMYVVIMTKFQIPLSPAFAHSALTRYTVTVHVKPMLFPSYAACHALGPKAVNMFGAIPRSMGDKYRVFVQYVVHVRCEPVAASSSAI